MCKIVGQWEFAVRCRELSDNLEGWDGMGGGREVQEGQDLYIPRADSCWSMAETNTTLQNNYPPTKNNSEKTTNLQMRGGWGKAPNPPNLHWIHVPTARALWPPGGHWAELDSDGLRKQMVLDSTRWCVRNSRHLIPHCGPCVHPALGERSPSNSYVIHQLRKMRLQMK